MTERARKYVRWGRGEFVLQSGEVAVKGEVAYGDTSAGAEVVAGQTSTTLVPIGIFDQSLTGDGVLKVGVTLFEEIQAEWLDNDDSNPVLDTDVFSECYVVDGRTVSISNGSSTRSKAGRVWAVDDLKGVLVQAGSAVTGPTGATGSGPGVAASRTALKAVAASGRYNGQLVMLTDDGSLWRFVSASAVDTDVAEELVLVPGAGTGRWLRVDKSFIAKIPIAFGLSDGALIWTIPAGMVVRLTGQPFWEVTTEWDGGTGSAIAIASSVTGYTAAGAILGGATGDVNATLQEGIIPGTIGTKLDTLLEFQAFTMVGGDDLTYEELTDAFTSGAGFVCVPVMVMLEAA